MNPWEVILWLFGWGAAALIFTGVAILVFAILVGGYRGMAKWFPAKKSVPDRKRLIENAEARAISLYQHSSGIELKVDAYVAGADYAWIALHPEK